MPCTKKKCSCLSFNEKFCKNYVAVLKQKKLTQREVFDQVWLEHPHKCRVCNDRLEEALAIHFFHILPKGGYPAWKCEKKNIILTCDKCHRDWHGKGRSELLQDNKNWQMIFDLYDKLKAEYIREN